MSARTFLRSTTLAVHASLRRRRPEDAVILSCEPRGGSTWLGELLAGEPGAAMIWEPLHLDAVPEARRLGFGWRQHIPAEADWPEARDFMARVLTGRVANGWTTSASPFRRLVAADRLVVKFCRANALLPWLARQFPFRRMPIHFLRHPFATAASQLRMGNFSGEALVARFTEGRYGEANAAHRDWLRGLRSEGARLVAQWALANRWPLGDPAEGRLWLRVHYEDLLSDPAGEIARIYAAWGETPPARILERVRTASRMTQAGALEGDAARQISKWRKDFTDAELDEMLSVLRHFGITCYGEESLPRHRPAGPGPVAVAR